MRLSMLLPSVSVRLLIRLSSPGSEVRVQQLSRRSIRIPIFSLEFHNCRTSRSKERLQEYLAVESLRMSHIAKRDMILI